MSETESLRKKLCCIDLLNAVADGYLDEVSSGLFFPNKEGHCKEGVPRIRYCPFCKAEIRPVRLESSWDYEVFKEAPPEKGLP